MEFLKALMTNEFVIMFFIALLGYALGRIRICGLSLGTSGVLIVALVFGHYGLLVPSLVRNLGLILFVTAVGFIAGPTFFRNFKKQAMSFILMGVLIVSVGVLCTVAAISLLDVPTALAAGMFTGALTSTPGLAAATEVLGDMAATGYGIAYPFGVVGVVLFVQLLPKLVHADMTAEVAKLSNATEQNAAEEKKRPWVAMDHEGFFSLAVAIVLGIVLAKITIPLPGGMSFSLGTSGGPLLAGLILGHFGHIGKAGLDIPEHTLETMRELGLMMFLMGAGTQAGQGFIAVLKEQGLRLFFIGALMTLVPMAIGYVFGKKVFRFGLLTSLGSITGGMTSTPALGALITSCGTGKVAASYAATYPVALIMVVVCTQIIGLIFQ